MHRNSLIIVLILTIVILLFFLIKKSEPFENMDNLNNYELPKIVWSYWNNENLPDTVKLIHKHRAQQLVGWQYNLLNDATIGNYIDLSVLPKNFDKLIVQHKADYYRLLLLKKYGGVWMDASIIVNNVDELNKLYNEAVQNNAEFGAFTQNPEPEKYKNHPDYSKFIENWFMMAPLRSNFINKLLDEYIFAIETGFDNYRQKIINDGVIIVDKINAYLTQYACMQVLLQKKLQYNPQIILKNAEKDMYKIHHECNWNNDCIINKFKTSLPEIHQIPYIKLRNCDREINLMPYFAQDNIFL
jgi:hypothetical protein